MYWPPSFTSQYSLHVGFGRNALYHAAMTAQRVSIYVQLAAVVGGVVLGVLLLMALEAWIAGVVPRSAGSDMAQSAAVSAWIAGWPRGLQVLWVMGWLLAGVAAGVLTAAASGNVSLAWISGALLTISAILNVTLVSHPDWMGWALVLAPLAGSWLGSLLPGLLSEPDRPSPDDRG